MSTLSLLSSSLSSISVPRRTAAANVGTASTCQSDGTSDIPSSLACEHPAASVGTLLQNHEIPSTHSTKASEVPSSSGDRAANRSLQSPASMHITPPKSAHEQPSTSSSSSIMHDVVNESTTVGSSEPPRRMAPARRQRIGCSDIAAYSVVSHIGSGTYGSVSKGVCKRTGKEVAIKKLLKLGEDRQGFPLTTMREIKCLKQLHHQNIVNLLDICVTEPGPSNAMLGEVYMVFECCQHDLGGILSKLKHRHLGKLDEKLVKCYLHQLLTGLAHMHEKGWVHRDLKPANLLLTNDNELKIADLGLAKHLEGSSRMSPIVVTLWYRAPELLLHDPSTKYELDVWSVGCIFGEMLTGQPIFSASNELQQITQIYRLCGIPDVSKWPSVKTLPTWSVFKPLENYTKQFKTRFSGFSVLALDLLEKMLTLEPKMRITAADALKHPYFLEGDGVPDPRSLPVPFTESSYFPEPGQHPQLAEKPKPAVKPAAQTADAGFAPAPDPGLVVIPVSGLKRPREPAAAEPPRPPPAARTAKVPVVFAAMNKMRTLVGGARATLGSVPTAAQPSASTSTTQTKASEDDDDDLFMDSHPAPKKR